MAAATLAIAGILAASPSWAALLENPGGGRLFFCWPNEQILSRRRTGWNRNFSRGPAGDSGKFAGAERRVPSGAGAECMMRWMTAVMILLGLYSTFLGADPQDAGECVLPQEW